jgi:nucleoside-diphosphate-sugar epimerase
MENKKIFVTGGGGYCGTKLVPLLLEKGYKVTVYDTFYFGNFLPKNKNINIINGDIRDCEKILSTSKGHDIFLSLACISNDASFELDENLSTSINLNSFEPMVIAAKKNKIKRFIYASSSSVYGVSDKPDVTEDHPLVPLTLYNKYKGECEPILEKHTDENFTGVTFRPATVCGYSPRLRLDLSVNILTNHAVNKNVITVFGGDQLRPNLHIKDYCKAVQLFIDAPKEIIANEKFNVGYQNLSIMDIAKIVKKVVEKEYDSKKSIDIIRTESDDNRSYHINSDKIKKLLGFEPEFTIEDAVKELCDAFKNKLIDDSFNNDMFHNVKRLKSLNIK